MTWKVRKDVSSKLSNQVCSKQVRPSSHHHRPHCVDSVRMDRSIDLLHRPTDVKNLSILNDPYKIGHTPMKRTNTHDR